MHRYLTWIVLAALLAPGVATGDEPVPLPRGESDTGAALRRLEERVNQLQEQMQEKDRRISELEEQVKSQRGVGSGEPASSQEALEQALDQLERDKAAAGPTKQPALLSVPIGGQSQLRLIDISLDVLFGLGSSTADDEALEALQGGAHDPKRRGFTLQQAELSLAGAVDPYFFGEAHIVLTDEVVELEEAFLVTQTLPYGLEFEAGYFLTEFGRINPTHAHAWDWVDQPIINTRLFGGDGMRGAGFRLGWLAPLPWFSELHFGMQNATGHTMPSFRGEGLGHGHGHDEEEGEHHFEEGIGGRPIVDRETRSLGDLVYLARWANSWDVSDEVSLLLGASSLYGPNNTGHDGETWIYGGDLTVKWRAASHSRGFPFVTWQTEVMRREFGADAFFDDDDPMEVIDIPAGEISDWGLYTQLLYGFSPGWSAGVRYEYATGDGGSFEEGEAISHNDDPFRDERHRLSPLLVWEPTEFSRLRLQYNYDWAQHLDEGDAHSVWLVFEVLFGSHAAHKY